MNRIKRRIEHSLENNWSTNNQKIQVNVLGHNVNLQGTVYSHYQKEEATRLVWDASEVWSVNNELVVDRSN
jgi:osmotically-inducible protein OsmY